MPSRGLKKRQSQRGRLVWAGKMTPELAYSVMLKEGKMPTHMGTRVFSHLDENGNKVYRQG